MTSKDTVCTINGGTNNFKNLTDEEDYSKNKSLIVPHTELYHKFQLVNDVEENQIKLTNPS